MQQLHRELGCPWVVSARKAEQHLFVMATEILWLIPATGE
jgi:hypothetical protein